MGLRQCFLVYIVTYRACDSVLRLFWASKQTLMSSDHGICDSMMDNEVNTSR